MARRKIIDKQPSAQEGLEVASRYGADERRRGFSPRLKVIFLGGLNQIGRNITAYEYGEDIIVVDCGVSFPDDNMLGVDLVIPDTTYLEKNAERVRGLVLTHGHEDHIGAVPFLLKKMNIPVYGTALTLGILENKLAEHGIEKSAVLNVVELGSTIQLGEFSVEFITVNHSIADAAALAITSPAGVVVHTGDFKIDLTPPEGTSIDLARLAALGSKGVLALLCESTNVDRPGYTPSETVVSSSLDRLLFNCDKRVIIATFSTNVHRVQQIINASCRYGRKVAITGRSMINVVRAAIRLGYIKSPEGTLIEASEIKRYKPSQITLLTTGSQGEPMSALHRMAFGDHSQISVGSDDLVILSSSAIPGNEKLISNIINELLRRGCEVVNDDIADVHVSGHACREEIKIMHALTKPRYFIPMHGEYRHLKHHADLARDMGMDERNILVPEIGKVIEMSKRWMKVIGSVPAGTVLVDGYGVGDIGLTVLRDRKRMSEDGLVVVAAAVESVGRYVVGNIEVVSRGFVYVKEAEELISETSKLVERVITERLDHGATDMNALKNKLCEQVSGFLYQRTKRRPIVIAVINEV